MYRNCTGFLSDDIALTEPRVVLVFGDIVPLQKIVNESRGLFWYNIEHPLTLLKNPDLKRPAWSTLKLAQKKIAELGL